jgi:hypothetical protein
VLAAAAAVALTLGLLRAREATQVGQRLEDNQAAAQLEVDDPLHASQAGEAAPRRSVHRLHGGALVEAQDGEPTIVLDEDADDEPTIVLDEDAADEPTIVLDEDASLRSGSPRSSRQDALRELDERAAARLAAGDDAGAEALYRQLVRQGGRSSLVELAYGDLFMLVHRRGDRRAKVGLWNEYLGKFPRGRFADDARAGLCRTAAADARASCWQRYLDDFPGGAYHREAARALHSG